MLIAPAGMGAIALVAPEPSVTWRDGDTVTIRWRTLGDVSKVRFYFHGERCKLGGRSRGEFGDVIGEGMLPNTGELQWTVPWLDATSMYLRLAAYDDNDQQLAWTEREVRLLPREFEDLPQTCIAVSKKRQRLVYFQDGEVKRMHVVSTAAPGYTTPRMKPGSRDRRRGKMGQVFGKAYMPFSRMYRVTMPYWLAITSSGSHGIHATTPRFYGRLGRPASHGCIRQHRTDAQVLYKMVDVGTPVYVF